MALILEKVNTHIRSHTIVYGLALAVSFVYASHHFFIPRTLGPEKAATYRPLTFEAHPDAAFYGLRANTVYHGQWAVGDVTVLENAASPWMLPPMGAWIIGGMGRMLGSLDAAIVVCDLLFPPLIFISLYLIAFEITRRRPVSLVFASVFIFIPMALLAFPPVTPGAVRMLMERIMPESASILYFARLEYPKTTFLFYALAIWGVLRAIRRDERWSTVLAGVCFGIMFYTYLYDWAYFFIALSLAAGALAIMKQYRALLRLAAIAGIGFVIAIPYWYNMYLLRQLPHYQDLVARIGVEMGSQFRWGPVWKSYVRIALLAVLAALAMPKEERPVLVSLIGFLAAFVVAVNLQVVLSFNPHPDHWYRISFLPIAMALLAAGYWAAVRWLPARILGYGGIVAVACIVVVFARSLVSQYQYSARDGHAYALDPAYAASYAWLAEHAPKNATVATLDFLTNSEVAFHTPQRTFVLNGVHTTVSDEVVWDRFLVASAAAGVTPERFSGLIREDPVLFHLTHSAYRDRSFDSSFRYDEGSVRRLPDDVHARLTDTYAALYAAGRKKAAERIGYMYAGPREGKIAPVVPPENAERVYDAGGVQIYKVITR